MSSIEWPPAPPVFAEQASLAEWRRLEALKCATGIMPLDGVTGYTVVQTAREFEAYLRGDDRG